MTAYEMRISDWSSDVCSSDLHGRSLPEGAKAGTAGRQDKGLPGWAGAPAASLRQSLLAGSSELARRTAQGLVLSCGMLCGSARSGGNLRRIPARDDVWPIGRATCRERVCQYV